MKETERERDSFSKARLENKQEAFLHSLDSGTRPWIATPQNDFLARNAVRAAVGKRTPGTYQVELRSSILLCLSRCGGCGP